MIIPVAIGAIILAWALWPKKKEVQTVKGTTPSGEPATVVVAVPDSVTHEQANPVSYQPPIIPPTRPTPILNVPQNPNVHANAVPIPTPAGNIAYGPATTVSQDGTINIPPILITSTGATSSAIGTILDIQKALNTLDYANPPLKEDGISGNATKNAIKAFQSAAGLQVDGIAGPATKAALAGRIAQVGGFNSHIGQSPMVMAATMQSVSSSVSVVTNKDIQHALNALGANPALVEDGALGPKSIAAIKAFQFSHGLASDGIAGPKTKMALALALKQNNQKPAAVVAGESSSENYGYLSNYNTDGVQNKGSISGYGSEAKRAATATRS